MKKYTTKKSDGTYKNNELQEKFTSQEKIPHRLRAHILSNIKI
jgi:hypothetical protein